MVRTLWEFVGDGKLVVANAGIAQDSVLLAFIHSFKNDHALFTVAVLINDNNVVNQSLSQVVNSR
jgi:hypothetical protein